MSELAIFGGPKTRTEPYPAWPVWDERDLQAVMDVVRSGRWGGYPYPGPQTAELARKFSELQGGGYAVPMINGTVTMEVALRAASIGWGDEVIVPAYTFQATASAPMSAGAIPVIVRERGGFRRTRMCLACRTVARSMGADMVDERPARMAAALEMRDETGAVLNPEAVR